MCGIAGVLEPEGGRASAAEMRALASALAHRGPDDEGFLLDGPLGLAHRRLAILDLTSAGHQPMANEDGTVHVVYNGQLFGFEDERRALEGRGHRFRSRTDTELLVHLYEEYGDALVDRIDGMFAFALWDSKRRRLLLARDRLGIKPLYLLETPDGRLAFASELKALRRLRGAPDRVDPLALVHYLYQSSVPRGHSVLAGYRQLAPGHVLAAEGGRIATHAYWTVPREDEDPPRPDARARARWAEELAGHLGRATASHLVADVPVGAFLSGGLDSAAVTQEAVRASGAPLHSFSVRFAGPRAADEGPAARETAEALGTLHHELVLGPEALRDLPEVLRLADEPFAISSAIALHHLARFARETVKVVLTGDGADEILAGYPWRHEPDAGRGASARARVRGLAMTGVRSLRGARGGGPGLAGQLRGRLRRRAHGDARYAEIVSAFTPDELQALLTPEARALGLEAWADHPVRVAYREEAGPDEVNRRLRTDLRTTLVDEMLTKVDRVTMAHGLEARVPFLDRGLVEWAMRLPGSAKVRGGVGKRVLREALAPTLPAAARRPKHGFNVPLGAWLRGPLRGLVTDVLAPDAVRRRGLLDPAAVERLLHAHLAGRGDHARKLFTLAALGMWLDAEAGGRVAALASAR